MENSLNLTRDEYERTHRDDTRIIMLKTPSKISTYYKGEFGPIETLPIFVFGIFTSFHLSDEAKDEFKHKIMYNNCENGKFRYPPTGIVVFLNDHFFGIFDDFEYIISLTPDYPGGRKLFQIANGGNMPYKITVK